MKLRTCLSYDDVLLVPQYSDIVSREQINIGNWLDEARGLWFDIPLISAPMDTVVEEEMAIETAKMKMLSIVHRYNSIERQADIASNVFAEVGNQYTGFAIGATDDFLERAKQLVNEGAKILCIDVAHGHHIAIEKALKSLRDAVGNKIHIMAGNVATAEAYADLTKWGANSIRVGIGGGCFVAGTKILLADGNYKNIEDIVIGDRVITHLLQEKDVIDTFVYEKDENLLKINEKITCTKNHEFYVIHKKHIAYINDENIHEYAEWIHAEHLTDDFYLVECV